jgi:glycerophosphoryl diester phosphodiesterase
MSLILLIHTLIFILFWLTNSLFYSAVNDYLAGLLGTHLDYISICLVVSVILSIWSAVRLFLLRQGRRAGPQWLAGVLMGVYLLFFYGSFALLFSQDPAQITRLGNLVQYFRVIFDFPALFVLVWLLRKWLLHLTAHPILSNSVSRSIVGMVLALAVFLPVYFPPENTFKSPPGTEPQNPPQLFPKPRLVAHRGASMLAPENTLASAEMAARLGVYGLEGDIRISLDGMLFLMHDDTLQRTTNVAEIFPARKKENAANFTSSELRQLNAGQWFVSQDPYGSIASGLVPAADVERFKTESIPTLTEILKVVKEKKLVFIFDLLPPPKGHPYFDRFFDLALQQIKEAGIDDQIWFLADGAELQQVRAAAPDMILVAAVGPATQPIPETLKAQGYSLVNSEYSMPPASILEYYKGGVDVNLWTVDEPWQFSRLWLTGATSITTNNAQTFIGMQEPIFAIPGTTYRYIWGALSLFALGILYFKIPPAPENRSTKK